METRPVGMRLEFRDWYYNSDRLRYEGLVYNDINDFFRDGVRTFIYPRDLKEVRPMTDVTIFEFKDGERWFALVSTRLEDI